METLFLPISLFGKQVFKSFPDYFQTIPVCCLVFYFIYLVIKKRKKFNLSVDSGTLLFLLIMFVVQGIATMRTILTFPMTGIGVFEKYFQFIALIVYFELIYLILKNNIDEDRKVKKFLNGFFYYGIILSILLFVQFIFIETGLFYSLVNFLGNTFSQTSYSESHNPNYLTSTVKYLTKFKRPNGLDPEGRDVAIRLSLVVVPFCLAAFKNNYQLFKKRLSNRMLYFVMLAFVIFFLIVIKTMTGVILAILTTILMIVVILLKTSAQQNLNRKIILALTLFLAVGSVLFSVIPEVAKMVGESNRTASMLAHWRVFLQHPLIGVGYDFSSPYAVVMAPEKYANSLLNINFYLANNQMPALSTILAWLSQFGLLIILPILFFLMRTKLDFTILIDRMVSADLDIEKITLYRTVDDLFFFLLIFLIPASFLLFDWRNLSYVMVIFFILVVKSILNEQLKTLAPLSEK